MFKKFLVALLIVGGIFSVGNFANAADKIDSGLDFQQMTTGEYYWARVINCNEWISLREYPSTSAPRLAKIPLGTIVKVSKYGANDGALPSPYNGFIRTQYNGQYGWCLLSYLRIGQSAGYMP